MRTPSRSVLGQAVGLFAWCSALAAQSIPNTLLVIADDVGVDGIGCYGYSTAAPTPNIDALAARGVRFTSAIVNPLCSPTRAALLTGRYGFRTGVGNVVETGNPLPASEVMLPELLNPVGVRTALIGKWHLGGASGPATPTVMGFQSFAGSMSGAVSDYYLWQKVENGTTHQETNYATTDLVDDAITFMQQAPEPWCLVLAFQAGHTPLHAPPAALHTQNLTGLNPTTTPVPFYKAMLQAMDQELGRAIASLSSTRLSNTNIVFLGDNGTASQVVEAPFSPQRSKGTVYQAGVRVPMIVAGPAVGGTARVEASLVGAVDLFPTLCALQGVDARAAVPASVALDGVSLQPLLQAANASPVREFAFAERFTTAPMVATNDREAVRDRQFELVRRRLAGGTVSEEMYDLLADPWESTNLLAAPLSAAAETAYRGLRRELNRLRGVSVAARFGVACSGGGLAPQLAVSNAPLVGTNFTVTISGLNAAATAAFGVIGFDDSLWNGIALPWAMDSLGLPGCTLYAAPAATRLLPFTGASATWSEAIPSGTAFIGIGWFGQGLVLAPSANAAGALATQAVQAVIGSS